MKNHAEIAIHQNDLEMAKLLLNSKKIDLNHCISKTKIDPQKKQKKQLLCS